MPAKRKAGALALGLFLAITGWCLVLAGAIGTSHAHSPDWGLAVPGGCLLVAGILLILPARG